MWLRKQITTFISTQIQMHNSVLLAFLHSWLVYKTIQLLFMSVCRVLVFSRCAILKAVLKMSMYPNVSLMLELFAHKGDTKAASVLATQLCEVISLVMMNDVSAIDHVTIT